MTDTTPPGFLDVELLLQTSQPRANPLRAGYGIALIALIVLMTSWAGAREGSEFEALRIVGTIGMFGVMIAMLVVTRLSLRANRDEQLQLQGIEELIQLRRWTDAGMMLQSLLLRPTRSQQTRMQSLFYLGAVLSRYHRFTDATGVYDYLLQSIQADDSTTRTIKLARAMAILQDEHLFDADRAIADLRRSSERDQSAGLALLEIARDVKTGHPQEAIELFEARLPILRQQLGHRLGDTYALVARAYDLAGRENDAQRAFESATLLVPLVELTRRYPEVATIAEKYRPAYAPPEAA